ncbi:hypothetical protein [Longimicrobium sp.]|uniref:hypothetical protein n=1 Tax=Longimicrobium sp. TaxID=2029185 RepID=UPI002CE5248D|nr:hypothetical protein [Longimicrobium sp.]HSU18086.1 hypothetical protein [Longimicrobium sp.]
MTTLFSAAVRMPQAASVIVPAPLAHGAAVEPCAPAMLPAGTKQGVDFGGIIAPAIGGRRGGSEGGDRFGSRWYQQDQAQLAGGGPLRG